MLKRADYGDESDRQTKTYERWNGNLGNCIINISKIKEQTIKVADTVYSKQDYEPNR